MGLLAVFRALQSCPPSHMPSWQQFVHMVLGSRAAATLHTYATYIRKWLEWCKVMSVDPLGPSSAMVTVYISHVAQKATSAATVNSCYSALTWLFKLFGLTPCPTSSSLCHALIESSKRQFTGTPNRKKHFTPGHIHSICSIFAAPSANLLNLRIAALLALNFTGFLRINEALQLKIGDLDFQADRLLVHFGKKQN